MELNKIYHMDCLEGMKRIADGSVDMILCDLPYGTTACKWDIIIPFEPLWKQYERVIKDNGAIVLTASQPFTSALVMSNYKLFKYGLVWDKCITTTPMLAKVRPLKSHEDVCVFYKSQPVYNPQMELLEKTDYRVRLNGRKTKGHVSETVGYVKELVTKETFSRYPKTVIKVTNGNQYNRLHPTQKPVALFEYLIKTYSNEGDTVLDNCMGSGTTAIACINTNRNYIGFEKEEKYFNIIQGRINKHTQQLQIF